MSTYFSGIFQTSKTPYIGYNSSGRGIPDISAQSTRYEVVIGGKIRIISGTSASAPVIAGMISLVNAGRLAAGKNSVGWFNPLLYTYYQSFTNDITEGKNNCVAQSSLPCCPQGFSATTGWDPTTGWGTIDYSRFKVFMSGIDRTRNPTERPTASPTKAPTVRPTRKPTRKPTQAPTRRMKLRIP